MLRYENQSKPDEMLYDASNTSTNDLDVVRMLRNALSKGEILTGYCEKCQQDGTLVIDFSPNIKGYIPRNEVTYVIEDDGQVHKGKCRSRVGRNVRFVVKEINQENGIFSAILSRKEVVEEIKNRYSDELKPGMAVQGVVYGMQPYGAFIDIGGDVSGVLSVADIARVFITHPSEVLKLGQVLDVVVSSMTKDDNDNITISFSRKELLPDWDEIDKFFKRGDTVLGRVKQRIDTGVFIELNESFEGLAEFEPGINVKYGDTVRVTIDVINKEKHKIKLRFN